MFIMTRIFSIDFTKGTLVLFMVVYHSLNYLRFGSLPHHWLMFLSPSFIMMTGFIVSLIYMQKYHGDVIAVSLRLGVRSAKIFFLFIVLNITAHFFWSPNHYRIAFYFENFKNEMIHVFLIGTPWISAFEILLPISYTLAAAVIVIRLRSVIPFFPLILAVAVFLLCFFLEKASISFYNLNMLSAGFIGMAAGLLPQEILYKIRPPWTIIITITILYVVLIRFVEDQYSTQMLVTGLALIIISSAGSRMKSASILKRQVATVGRYSLLSYIVQIFFLQLLRLVAIGFNKEAVHPLVLITIVMILTWVFILIVDYTRKRVRYIDVLYKSVFA